MLILCCAKKHIFVLKHYNNFLVLFFSEKIAFHASLSSDIRGTTVGQTIVFNQVDTNLGVFTAPVAGTYVFSLTFFLYYGSSSYSTDGYLEIIINSVVKLSVYQENNGLNSHGTGSGTTVLLLTKGDEVHVSAERSRMHIVGYSKSFFSGFMLW